MTSAARNPVSPAEVLGGNALPHSKETEMALLGAMMFDQNVIGDVIEVIDTAEAFYFQSHQILFEAIKGLFLARKPVDAVVLRDTLAKDRHLDAIGGVDYMMSLVEGVPNAANAAEYAKTVYDKFVLRTIIQTCQTIVHQATKVTEDVEEVRDAAEKAIFQALAKGEKAKIQTLTEILHETFQQIQDFHDRKARLLGLSTGFYEIDDLLSGLQPGQLYVVAGRPSMGKTSFALNIMEHVAIHEEKPVMLFSLEMAASQIAQSMLCSRARIDSKLLRTGMITEEDYARLLNTAGVFGSAKFFVDDSADLSALEIRTRARRLKAREDIQLVVVDYLQKMHAKQGSKAPESRQLEISMISSNLKSLAKELHVPVIALAQLNRAAEGREDRKPMLSDLRESGAIEQDADAVMALYREEYYKPDTERKNTADVLVLKNRTGPVGSVEMTFLKEFTRFENRAKGPQ